MVATSQPLATQAGLHILMAGGNAVDAAVATAAVLNVVEPMSTGIGGDVFALFYHADKGKVHALNGSGRAPLAATPEVFRQRRYDSVPLHDILAVTVPGAVDAWDSALKTHGTLTLAQVLTPAIHYAEEGFPVSEIIAQQWQYRAALLEQNEAARQTYLIDGKRPPHFGEIFIQPNIAHTLRLIAEGGRDAFYRGPIAEEIVRSSEALGGLLTLDDFAHHFSTWEEPISTSYHGYTVYECPPNGQGLSVLLALNILSGEDIAGRGVDAPDTKHIMIEALRHAMADSYAFICDPALANVPAIRLLSAEYAARRRAEIDMHHTAQEVSAGDVSVGEDTVYLTVVDAQGNAASFINSLYFGFGSGIVAGNTGIALQNRGAGFTLKAGHPNCIAPGKRPFHTIIPCMVLKDGQLWSSMGVMGGHMQPQGHVQVLSNMIDFGMTPQQALDAPRFEISADLTEVALEAGIAPEVKNELIKRGHHVIEPGPFGFGGGQVIVIDPTNGARLGGSDPRKDGCASGY
jgi:gamma-glutamyltranspeptidase/glutathione hydrolase